MSQHVFPIYPPMDYSFCQQYRDCSQDQAVHHADGTIVSAGLDAMGRETPDPFPMEVPLHLQAGPSLSDTVRRLIQGELSKIADDSGYETFEEADDFDIEDDPADPHTPYEAVFDPPLPQEPDPGKTSVDPVPGSPQAPLEKSSDSATILPQGGNVQAGQSA